MKTVTVNSVILLGWLLAISVAGYTQNPDKFIRQGNKFYEENDYSKAETSYLKALETDSTYIKGLYNRADALYEQEEYGEAAKLLNTLTNKDLAKNDLAATWHNLGNSMVKARDYQKAVEAYKNALRNNPDDKDTKYNLTYALEKLKEQKEQKQDKNNQQNEDKDEQDQQKDNKQQDQQNKDNQEKDNKNQEKDQEKNQKQSDKQDDKQKQQPQPKQISRQDAERMLQALKNSEKETMKDLKRIKAKGEKTATEKDW